MLVFITINAIHLSDKELLTSNEQIYGYYANSVSGILRQFNVQRVDDDRANT